MTQNKIHYGWIITIACGLILFSGLGIAFNTFTVFLEPLAAKIGMTGTQTSSLISILSLMAVIGILFSSSFYVKKSVRHVSFLCGLSITAGYALLAFANNYIVVLVGASLLGVGYGTYTMVPVSILMKRWFFKKRGTAIGLATSATGISTFILPPLLTGIIETVSLEAALITQAVVAMLIATISYILIRNYPDEKNIKPYGYEEEEKIKEIPQEKPNYLTLNFITLAIAAFLFGSTLAAIYGHVAPILISIGYSPMFSSLMISVYGITIMLSKIASGVMIDKVGIFKSNFIVVGYWLAAMIVPFLIDGGHLIAIIFAIFVGLGGPIGTVFVPIWTGDLVKAKHYTRSLTTIQAFFSFGAAIGSLLPGIVFDMKGSYIPTFYIFIACVVVGVTIIQIKYMHKKNLEKKDEK